MTQCRLQKGGPMKKILLVILLLALGITPLAYGKISESSGNQKTIVLPPEQVTLNPGKGQDKVLEHCAVCHSLDYILMQPRGTKAQWTATVQKMIRLFGAAIPEDTAQAIAEYLYTQYGSGK
jgi:sulfite dehydrogenase (cytochrome) subunit B